MSLRICVSYETPEELAAVDRALRKLAKWRVRDAKNGKYPHRYYTKSSQNLSTFGKPLDNAQAGVLQSHQPSGARASMNTEYPGSES